MIYRFHGLQLDTELRELTSNNHQVAFPPKALSVLIYMIENRDRMVTKSELLDQFWTPNVSEAALQTTISVIRKAIDVENNALTCIKTYHGRGFRFVAPVELQQGDVPDADDDTTAPSSGTLLQEKRWVSVLTLKLGQSDAARSNDLSKTQVDALIKGAEAKVRAAKGRLTLMMFDGFSATFGLDPHLEDGTRLALTCAHQIINLEVCAALEDLGMSVSIGVDAGATIYTNADVDPAWKMPGGVVRGSADLANRADGGQILVSIAVKNLLRDEIETQTDGDAFVLLHPPDERAGLSARPFKRQTAFVGRGAEMSFLRESLSKCSENGCQTVLLLGPAGIGKSRLVSEFLTETKRVGDVDHKYFCLPRHSETPLALLRQMCVDLFTDIISDLALDQIDTALMQGLLDDAERPDPVLESVSDHSKRKRTQAMIGRLVAQISAQSRLVLVFEDVHWIDTASRRYLEALIRNAPQKGLMIILTARPTDRPALTESVLQLAPLGPTDSKTMLHQIPELTTLAPPMLETLVQRAAGNPFFLEELAHAMRTGADPARDLPDTVQAVIEVRIGELESNLRMIVYVISVVGQPADPDLIAHLMNATIDAVQPLLDRLITLGFLHEEDGHYACRHMLLQDTANAMLVQQERSNIHGQIAAYLETKAQTNPVRPEILASHFQEAGDVPRAINYWTKAAYAALFRSAQPEAVIFSGYGLELIARTKVEGSESEMLLQLARAQALMAMKGYGFAGVGAAFDRVYALSRILGKFKYQVRALVGLWVHTWVRGQLAASINHAKSLIKMGTVSNAPSLLIQGHGGLGEVLTHTGKLSQAMTHLEMGMDVVQDGFPATITDQNAAVTCAAYAAWVSAMQGRLDDMQLYYTQSRDLSALFENRFAQAIHLALCSEAFMFAGDVDTCLDLATRAVELSREHDFPFWLGTGLVMRGWALGEKGETDLGLTELEQGIAVFERTGARVQLANWYGLKAETLLRAGRLDDARTAAGYALDRAERTGDIWFTPRIYAVMSKVLTALDQFTEADACDLKIAHLAEREHLAEPFTTIADSR